MITITSEENNLRSHFLVCELCRQSESISPNRFILKVLHTGYDEGLYLCNGCLIELAHYVTRKIEVPL
jgi:hypothetical protein